MIQVPKVQEQEVYAFNRIGGAAGSKAIAPNAAKPEFSTKNLSLPLRYGHDKPIQLIAHLDLTRKPRVWPHIIGKVEHVLFHDSRFARDSRPSVINVDMASGASACTAAFGFNPRHGILDGRFHHRRAVHSLNFKAIAAMGDKGQFCHDFPKFRAGDSWLGD
jgi:hypothetical protein